MADVESTTATLHLNRRTGEFTLSVPLDSDIVLKAAKRALAQRFKRHSCNMDDPGKVKEYLVMHLAPEPRETFVGLFLDTQNRLIAYEVLFRGAIDEAHIYPREVVKAALRHNAAKVIVAHNHPSGDPKPSVNDQLITYRLLQALMLVEIPLIDHFVVGGDQVVSMAAQGIFGKRPRKLPEPAM
ncbi:DNA repair protein [Hahella chejuensis KCTC 2396]|uniref:DNA repair protein n=1 Tax=Hahella chejuensis (strain KCTC 2396) TaxID=349521 RepID=Q2SAG7_HAHCH|nr:DNA repair protein RadC [Hahella chejuensis]ABC32357.1 DNA repair protein [Hahella chejuensis KCTC 2396]